MPEWSRYKNKKFKEDLKVLFDTYGVANIINMTAGYHANRNFILYDGTIYQWGEGANDKKEADAVIRHSLYGEEFEKALVGGDWERCATLHKKLYPELHKNEAFCTDCDSPIKTLKLTFKCKKCGDLICHTCFEQSDKGLCAHCEYPVG